MIFNKQEQIKMLLNTLKYSIENSQNQFIVNSTLPSLLIWASYQEYLTKILALFSASDKRGYETLAIIVTELDLDEFIVDARVDATENKKRVLDYIERIINKLNKSKRGDKND